MRRVIFAAFFSFTFIKFGFAGCGEENVEPIPVVEAVAHEPIVSESEGEPTAVESTSPAAPAPVSPFSLTIQGIDIQMGANMNEVKDALGEPIAEFKMPSCAFDGTDIVYRFPGVQVHTIPIGDANYIHTISISDDTVSTHGGIKLGSSVEELISVYGYDYAWEYGMYTFTRGHTSISFFVDSGIVIAITYELDVNMYFEVG